MLAAFWFAAAIGVWCVDHDCISFSVAITVLCAERVVTRQGDYSVSLNIGSRIRHFKITRAGSSWQFGERIFPSITALVEFYETTPIFTTADGVAMHLLTPFVVEGEGKSSYYKAWS